MKRPEQTQKEDRNRESNGQREYAGLVTRFREIVRRAVPPGAVVAVVSKGDHGLLDLGSRRAWHFPQREDGEYAGYYPADSAAAIAHLEGLRDKGADFLALPATALWWLDHYVEFRQHLESRYRPVVESRDTCVMYALSDPPSRHARDGGRTTRPATADPSLRRRRRESRIKDLVDGQLEGDLRTLFDATHYSEQVGLDLGSPASALLHYLEVGYREGRSPHPLFDAGWYVRRHPEVQASDVSPLVHFLTHAVTDGYDPSPFFDTEYYYSQRKNLRDSGVNALVHYVRHARDGKASSPNPLFQDRFYLQRNSDVREGDAAPLAHFIQVGCQEGRLASQTHTSIVRDLQRASRQALLRGQWKSGTVLLFCYGEGRDGIPDFPAVADRIQGEGHVGAVVVAHRAAPDRESDDAYVYRAAVNASGEMVRSLLLLDDYSLACDIFRPSAQRLLAKMLAAAIHPLWVISEVPEVLDVLEADGVGTYLLLPQAEELGSSGDLRENARAATRMILPSSEAFHAVADALGELPTNVALAADGRLEPLADDTPGDSDVPSERAWAKTYTESLLKLAHRDFGYDHSEDAGSLSRRNAWPGPSGFATKTVSNGRPKIVIPCTDWAVNGVNSVIERLLAELDNRGWDVELLFTRDEAWVHHVSTIGGRGDGAGEQEEAGYPSFPYRFLRREGPGLEGMWTALIAYLETSAPCILLMGYDFYANGVASALTEAVGVVLWVQADDGDWNEQAYRLGRYCNAVVCVVDSLKDKIAAMNPAIGARTEVIHNSTAFEADVHTKRPRRTSTMRIVYHGRLVQYQKRILDFISLAQALDRTEAPYEITFIGDFWARVGTERAETQRAFEQLAKAHIEDGRIRLLGGMRRAELLEELGKHDFHVLLSDFEGLPLAMVEAMARGCIPVFPEWENGIPEVVQNGKNGLVVSGRDYDEWASLLVGLWRDKPRLARMSRSARATIRKGFTIEALADGFEELFERVTHEMTPGTYRRPPSLKWGERSWTGDVLPPQSLYRPGAVEINGLSVERFLYLRKTATG